LTKPVDAQPADLRFERLARYPKFRGRSGRSGDSPTAFGSAASIISTSRSARAESPRRDAGDSVDSRFNQSQSLQLARQTSASCRTWWNASSSWRKAMFSWWMRAEFQRVPIDSPDLLAVGQGGPGQRWDAARKALASKGA